jgi:hypothetical protein
MVGIRFESRRPPRSRSNPGLHTSSLTEALHSGRFDSGRPRGGLDRFDSDKTDGQHRVGIPQPDGSNPSTECDYRSKPMGGGLREPRSCESMYNYETLKGRSF